MAEPFIGEVKLAAFGAVPRGWAECDGRLLPVNGNQALFSLIGTQFGGDGRTTFALPDLRGRVPIGAGLGPPRQGDAGGEPTHTLTTPELPAHRHRITATATPGGAQPTGGSRLAASAGANLWGPPGTPAKMAAAAVSPTPGAAAHDNVQPSIAVHFIIALQGIFPSRN